MRASVPQPVEVRHMGLRRGRGGRIRADAPAVKNAQNNRFMRAHRLGPFFNAPLLAPNTARGNVSRA